MMSKRKTLESSERNSEAKGLILEYRLKSALNEPRIASLEEAMNRYYSRNSLSMKRIVIIAAVFFVMLAVPAIIYFIGNSPEKGLYNSYFMPDNRQQVTGIYRGLDVENNMPFLLFSEGKLHKALPELRLYLDKYPADMQARLIIAICLMDDRKFSEAEVELKLILESRNFYFSEDAHWYLALIQVRKGNYPEAMSHLKIIENSKIYALQAQSLQKKLF